MVCKIPSDNPSHKRALSWAERIGGEQIHFAPSGRRRSSMVKNKYCGHVSPITLTPRSRAYLSISTSPPAFIWTMYTLASAADAMPATLKVDSTAPQPGRVNACHSGDL